MDQFSFILKVILHYVFNLINFQTIQLTKQSNSSLKQIICSLTNIKKTKVMINAFQQNEQKVKRQAMQIRAKLIEKKQKKQQQYQKLIKQQLIKQYQLKFDQFKTQIDQYASSQLTSLDLIKQFRLGQITQFQSKIAQFIKALQTQQKTLTNKKQQLQDSLTSAIEFLQHKKQKEIQQKRQAMQNQLQLLVNQYQERIQIQ